MNKLKPNYRCDYCNKPMYKTPSNLKRDNTHTCSRVCKTKLCMKCPSKTYIMELHWKRDMPLDSISKHIGINRSILTRYMVKNNIPYRSISEDNRRRYTYMTDDEIKNQTTSANKECRKLIRDGSWILCGDNLERLSGKDHPSYIHGFSKERWFKNTLIKRYKLKKKNQSPTLTEQENTKLLLYYKISEFMGEDWHVDHIKPISKGGLHHPDNLQVIPAHHNLCKNNNEDYVIPEHLIIRI